jgi:hypothetical protein
MSREARQPIISTAEDIATVVKEVAEATNNMLFGAEFHTSDIK